MLKNSDWRCTLTGVSWSLLYWANAPDAPSFNKLSLLSKTLTSLKTSLNSPGGECKIKSDTILTFSWSEIATNSSSAILLTVLHVYRLSCIGGDSKSIRVRTPGCVCARVCVCKRLDKHARRVMCQKRESWDNRAR